MAPGSNGGAPRRPRAPRGFTLIELLVVITLIAIATATVSLALRDPAATQLDREAERLAALLESARAEARADGLAVTWAPVVDASAADAGQFRFSGLPPQVQLQQHWLGSGVSAQVLGADHVLLGPEPMIGAQRILLSLGDQRVVLATDGLAPFELEHPAP